MKQRYVYFFQDAEARVKIGQSADPLHRLRALGGEVGHRLVVIGVMPSDDARTEEASIHRRFDEHRLEGEWFDGVIVVKLEVYRERFLAILPESDRLLLQTWVGPALREAVLVRAKSEGRTVANWLRYEIGKLVGVDE